jgi:ATP-dependent Clp protease ATP-binding subunit ClpB
MTSNLGSQILQDLTLTDEDKQKAVLEAVRHNFRPEFLNRVDEIIIFKPLTRDQIKHIVNIQLERLRKRLGERRITLQLTPAALELIANEGYDPVYGARPLKRVIQRRIQDPLAMAVLDGKFREGDTVLVDAEKGELVLRKAGAKEPAAAAAS